MDRPDRKAEADAVWNRLGAGEATGPPPERRKPPEYFVPIDYRRKGSYSIRRLVPCEDGEQRMATFSGPDEPSAYMSYYRYIRHILRLRLQKEKP